MIKLTVTGNVSRNHRQLNGDTGEQCIRMPGHMDSPALEQGQVMSVCSTMRASTRLVVSAPVLAWSGSAEAPTLTHLTSCKLLFRERRTNDSRRGGSDDDDDDNDNEHHRSNDVSAAGQLRSVGPFVCLTGKAWQGR